MVKVTALTQEDVDNCPVRQVLSKVVGKWQMLIVLTLSDGSHRFAELRRAIGDITQRVLTENLRGLERDGYLTRRVEAGPPLAVHYELTELGHELAGQLLSIVGWAKSRHADVARSRADYDSK